MNVTECQQQHIRKHLVINGINIIVEDQQLKKILVYNVLQRNGGDGKEHMENKTPAQAFIQVGKHIGDKIKLLLT